jgi:hypothetical protein
MWSKPKVAKTENGPTETVNLKRVKSGQAEVLISRPQLTVNSQQLTAHSPGTLEAARARADKNVVYRRLFTEVRQRNITRDCGGREGQHTTTASSKTFYISHHAGMALYLEMSPTICMMDRGPPVCLEHPVGRLLLLLIRNPEPGTPVVAGVNL